MAAQTSCSSGVKIPGSKSCHGNGLVKYVKNLRDSKNVDGMFLKQKGKKDKIEKSINSSELKVGRYSKFGGKNNKCNS